jgi:hypothetical protein
MILFSFCNFSLLPNRHRPPCSTMPWDILPALVVLWGVCWMFYPSPHKSQSDQYNARPYTPTQIQEGWSLFHSLVCKPRLTDVLDTEEFYLTQSLLNPSGQPWDWPYNTFEDLSDSLQPFDSAPQIVAQSFSEQMRSHNEINFQGLPSLDEALIQLPHIPIEASQDDPYDSQASTVNMYATHTEQQPHMNDLSRPNHAEDGQHSTQRAQPMATPITRTTTCQTVQNMTMPHTSLAPDIPARTFQNSEGRWTCDREGCERLTFKTLGAWQ